jgi:chemotaxis signal transduction protein
VTDLDARSEQSSLMVIGRIADRAFAVPARAVERILRMVAVTPLPGAPPQVAGVINLHGTILPVVDPRLHLDLPRAAPHVDHHLMVVLAAQRYALWMDEVERVVLAQSGDFETVNPSATGTPATGLVRIDGAVIPVLSVLAFDPGPVLQSATRLLV